jgi:hypothetical protein
VLLKAAGFIVTTIIAVLLVVANNIGTAANQSLLLAAAGLGVALILILLARGVQSFRRRRRPGFFFGVVHAAGRPATVHAPSTGRIVAPIAANGPAEVSLRDMAEADQHAFLRTIEAAKKAGPSKKPEPAPPRQVVAMPDVYNEMRKEPERGSLQREARQVRDTYRAMARTNGIDNTTGDVKRSMQERIDRLNERLALYCAKWSVSAVDASKYVPEQPQVGPAWLRAMVREADLVVWQLDHEGR